MKASDLTVSIHPYFKIRSGQMNAVRALLPEFIRKTAMEKKNLYYGFSLNGDELFCREAYVGADGLLEHVENVQPELQKMLTLTDIIRVEVHGPEEELAKLKGPLAGLKPAWFACLDSVRR